MKTKPGPLLVATGGGIDFTALATEINTDPTGIGYGPFVTSGTDVEVARLMNEVRTTVPTFKINRGAVPSQLVVNEIDATELDLLTTNQLLQLQVVTQFGTVDLGDASVRQILGGLFPALGSTRTALIALADRPAARAEVYPGSSGSGTIITAADVAKALRG